jgi:hypothetical protein
MKTPTSRPSRPSNINRLLEAIGSRLLELPTKRDLQKLEKIITMKLSEAKVIVAQSAAANKEAFEEITKLVTDLRKEIADAIAGNTDPEITDAEFAQNLADIKKTADDLAAVVPNVPPAPTPTE